MTVFHFEVNGLATTLQAERIEAMLRDLSGFDTVEVDGSTGLITVSGNDADAKRALEATTMAGYELASRRESHWGIPPIRWYHRGWLRSAA